MEVLLGIFAKTVSVFIDFIVLAMLVRALMSFFIDDPEGSAVFIFVGVVTEVVITPVRYVLFKFNILQDSPIDWAFMIAYLLITLLGSMLPVI